MRENGNDATGAFSQRYDDCTRNMPPCWHTSIRDGTPIFRYKPADNLFIVIKPEVEEVKIHDGPALIDWLFTSGAYFKFYSFCLGLHFSLTFTLLLSPVVWIDVTDTEEILFNKTNVTSGISKGLKSFSSVTFNIYMVTTSIVFTNWLFMSNSSMRRLQWTTMKWRIMATIGLNGVYTIAAATMFQNKTHGIYLYGRMVCLVAFVYFDSTLVYLKLRMIPKVRGPSGGHWEERIILNSSLCLAHLLPAIRCVQALPDDVRDRQCVDHIIRRPQSLQRQRTGDHEQADHGRDVRYSDDFPHADCARYLKHC